MMFKPLLVAACLIFAACEMMSPEITPTTSTLQNTGVVSPMVTPTPDSSPQWVETEMNSVSIGCWQPGGWTMDANDGLLLAEHAISLSTNQPLDGAMIYIFVPEVEHLDVAPAQNSNFAMSVLQQIAANPERTGHDVVVSAPSAFHWGDHQAAYYLITSVQDFKSMVIGIGLPDDHERLVVINVTVPAGEAAQMRRMLPRVLNELTINGVELQGTALDVLPDPLAFPEYPHT